jgi:hypothetical protein
MDAEERNRILSRSPRGYQPGFLPDCQRSNGRFMVPEILEASAELAAAEGDDGVCALYGPVHTRPLEPGSDY